MPLQELFLVVSRLLLKESQVEDECLTTIESKIDFVKDTLEGWQFPWLIVFDNYDQPSEFRDITSYLPRGGIGSIQVSTQILNALE